MTAARPRGGFDVRVYRVLLHLLPLDMRECDGADIEALFLEGGGAARTRGVVPFLTFFAASVWDVVRRAPFEHWRRRGRRPAREDLVMRSFVSDLRFAARSFGRQPGATALVVLTLALGVAANTAVFAIVDGLFLRPFPFRQPERLVYLNERAPSWNLEFTGINYPDFHTWRERARAFESMALFAPASINLADAAGADRVDGLAVTYDFPTVLGLRPVVGRFFTADEDKPTGPSVVVIGYGLWQTRFGGARDVVGKPLRINSVPYSIIGVLPPEGDFPGNVQFWVPLAGDPNQQGGSYSFDGIARMKPDVTVEEARADLMNAHAPIWTSRDSAHVVSPRLDPLRAQSVSNYRVMGKALGVGGALVLLIACANVAGAMLARSIFRRREMAVRMALGASASRVGRQLITESLALAAVAGLAGTLLGRWALRLITTAAPDQLPGWVQLQADARTVGFSVAVVFLTALVFGLAPAMQPGRQNLAGSLAWGGGARASGSLPQRRMLDVLVVIEVALALVLLAGSGLLLRAYANLRDVDPGFRADGVTTFRLALPRSKYPNGLAQQAFYSTLIERLEASPGVTSAGIVTCLPFGCHQGSFLQPEGAPPPNRDDSNPVVLTRIASPGYLETMGIALVRGRFFEQNEGTPRGPHPVVVNEEFARVKFPGVADPVGRRIVWNGDTTTSNTMTIVGVVRDVKHYGLATPMRPGIYLSTTGIDSAMSRPSFGVAVRSSTPASVAAAARAIVRQLDAELPLIELRTAQAAVDRSIAPRRAMAFAFAAFGFVALALAVGGIYAVLSYVVARRRQEIGIRMALGARRGQVVRLVVRQGLRLVALGVAIGLPLALLATGSLSTLLVGVSPRDPVTFGAAIGLLAVTAVVSALVPARRAAGVDPKTALGE